MNIFKKLFTKVSDSFSGSNDVKEYYLVYEDYMDLQEEYQLLNSKYKDSKICIEKLEEELIIVNTNYSNYAWEKTKEINTLKAKIESLEENKLLTKSISSYARLNKYLWALLIMSIIGNFYQALT